MREIEFRAWDKYENRMYSNVESGIYQDPDEILPFHKILEFASYEVMQYTGLHDKNGQKIFEGDIFIMGDRNIKHIVEWHDSGFMGKQNRTLGSYVGLTYWNDRIEIIGNIHENPELLEVKL